MSNNSPVNILEILKGVTDEAKKWVDEFGKRQANGAQYSWVFKIDNFLKQTSLNQLKFIREKFNGVNNIYQLFDKLTEILVAIEYKDEQPQFLQERLNKKTPDIFLKKTKRYIEVKNLNYSDEYKIFSEKNPTYCLEFDDNSYRNLSTESQKEYEQVLIKAKELISKAREQLLGESGFIYFVFNIDQNPLFSEKYNVNTKASRLIQGVEDYCLHEEDIIVVCKEFSQLLK